MNPGARFRINRPKIVSEIIDDEVVILNLDRGHYFSLRHTGADIWHALERGASVDEIIAHITGVYAGDEQAIADAVRRLLEQCESEELIVRLENTAVMDLPDRLPAGAGLKGAFLPPELTKFTDMEDLLLLDPIHEVDETGWPHQPNSTEPIEAPRLGGIHHER